MVLNFDLNEFSVDEDMVFDEYELPGYENVVFDMIGLPVEDEEDVTSNTTSPECLRHNNLEKVCGKMSRIIHIVSPPLRSHRSGVLQTVSSLRFVTVVERLCTGEY
nr:hypothetical protein CFP56_32712 [Quercus suber]